MKTKMKTHHALCGLLSLAAVLGQAQRAGASLIVITELAPNVGDSTAVDAELTTKISSTDLLQGIIPTSDRSIIFGSPLSHLGDGTGGEQDFDPDGRLMAEPNNDLLPLLWTITYSGLGGLNLAETRVFSWNSDTRASQKYDILYSTDNGLSFSTLITSVGSNVTDGTQLTRVQDTAGAFIATGVTDLRFVTSFVPNDDFFHSTAFVEIDAFSFATPVPEPGTALFGLACVGVAALRRRRHA